MCIARNPPERFQRRFRTGLKPSGPPETSGNQKIRDQNLLRTPKKIKCLFIPNNLPQNWTQGRFQCAESKTEVKNLEVLHLEEKMKENYP